MLTVIGFSVHDTIVVFDRIRENRARHAGEPFAEIVNHSILQTFGRSIMTSLTVVLTLLALLLFGGAAISDFVLALLIGIISGTYSSIFVASPAARRLAALGGPAARPPDHDPQLRESDARRPEAGDAPRPVDPRCSHAWHPDDVVEPRFRWTFPEPVDRRPRSAVAAAAARPVALAWPALLATRGVVDRRGLDAWFAGAAGRPPRPGAAARRGPASSSRIARGARARRARPGLR